MTFLFLLALTVLCWQIAQTAKWRDKANKLEKQLNDNLEVKKI